MASARSARVVTFAIWRSSSAIFTILRLYSTVNARRLAFLVTSVTSPRDVIAVAVMMGSSLALLSKLQGSSCLTHVGREGFCFFVFASPPPSAASPPRPRSPDSSRSSARRSTPPRPVLLPCYRSPSRRDFSLIPIRDSPSESPNRRAVSRRETHLRIPLGSPEQTGAVADLSSAKSPQRVFEPSFLEKSSACLPRSAPWPDN